MIDRNFIIAMVVAMTVIVSYNFYYEWRFGEYLRHQEERQEALDQAKEVKLEEVERPSTSGESQVTMAKEGPSAAGVSPVLPGGVAPTAPFSSEVTNPEEAAKTAMTGDVKEKFIRISTGVMNIILSNKGAAPVRMELSRYVDSDNGHIDLIYDSAELVAKQARQEDGSSKINVYPTFGIKFPRKAFSTIINNSFFYTDFNQYEIFLEKDDAPLSINYELKDSSGIVIRKNYTFYPDDYRFDFSLTVKSSPQWGPFKYSLIWFGLGDEESDFSSIYSYNGPIVMVGKQRMADAPEDDEPLREYIGEIKWAALSHRYFTMFGIPESDQPRTVRSRYIDDENSTLEWQFTAGIDGQPERMTVYVGPKAHKLLKQYENGVESIINYGWFDILAKPLFWLMTKFHSWTGNWGWAVILLTITTKTLFFPLTQKGFKSMQKLQKVQPQMKRLQEAYKNDKEKLNAEMIALYKEHKVNPLGGCLPIVLQIPIFFALYKVLLESIELKGAEWIWWIHDLTMKDPYYVTPVLMGASMLAQQLMTPATGDPMQRKVMMMLPVVFTIMFLSFPSGLVIYWLVNNLLTIGQQWIIKRQAD